MNGAESMLETLVANGVEVCFSNPGTSEMHMVAAIGKTERMRSILSLFEGVCSGAADGYGRMAGKPAATLLHIGSNRRIRGSLGKRSRIGDTAYPVRDRMRQTDHIRVERRVVFLVIGRVITNQVDDRCIRLARVVQVGRRVGESRP